MFQSKLPFGLPSLNPQVWILAFGRFLSQTGTGFTLFYAPIFFVNQVGLSATAVGIGLGSTQVSGVLGRLLGGSFCDSRLWGRRRTLLLSAIISAIASFVLAIAHDFLSIVAGNLLMGLGIGLYWPATETMVADLSTSEHRQEAFAVTRLADNLGLQMGIVLGGFLIATTGAYRALFIIDGLSFLIFFGVIYVAIKESYKPVPCTLEVGSHPQQNGWIVALRDRALLIYVFVNILFTLYISQIQSTMPLYFSNFININASNKGFSPQEISALFAFHTILIVALQLPIARALRRFRGPQALIVSAILWGIGFAIVSWTGMATTGQLLLAIIALSFLSVATVSYTPSASTLVVDLAPESLRGIYLAINSQCWAIGYLIGPPLGGWALDRGQLVGHVFWLGMALSIGIAIAILKFLDRILQR